MATIEPRRVQIHGNEEGILQAAEVLWAGGLVVAPTETFYGLAVRIDDAAAVARLARLKARQSKPVPVIAASLSQVRRRVLLSGALEELAKALWPGPLVVAAPPKGEVPSELTAGTGTVGIRVSSNLEITALAERAGGAVSATSANLAGQAPATRVDELAPALLRQVDLVLDCGPAPGGLASSVVGVRDGRVVVLRPGAISAPAMAEILGYTPQQAV